MVGILALPLLAACGGSGAAAKQAFEEAESWAATVRLLSAERSARAVSARYTRNALGAATEQLTRAARTLREQPPPGEARAGVAAVDSLRALVASLAGSSDGELRLAPSDDRALERLGRAAGDAAEAIP
jgi:hypothetical protein